MRPPCKRVAVVGGGFGGAFCVKWLKAEGIEPVCFEKSDEIGGTWRYREDDIEGLPSVMSTTTINHSKEFSNMPDFLFPKEFPNYLNHYKMYEHLRHFMYEFEVLPHIFCNREVIEVQRTVDYEETGRWSVSVKDTKNGNITTEIFDGVLVCVGFLSYPKMPKYPDMKKYKGKIKHTHSLKRFNEFTGQRVTVVGTGCSALDAAVEISRVAQKVYLSIRTPSWIVSRVGPYGMPIDYALCRRYLLFFQKIFPWYVISWIFERYYINAKFNHKLYGIEPKYHFLASDPHVSDDLSSKILSGAVVPKKDILYFTEDGVVFDGEKQITKTDTVIMATGYKWKFDFLEKGTVKVENGRINLYKCIYPTQLKHPTLAIIGFALPLGPGFPIGDLQMRWAVHLLANRKNLPSEQAMLRDVKNRHKVNMERYSHSELITIRVDFIPYMDELATELGVMPNFWKMALTDPKLFLACIFGPCIPPQYRLEGPHKFEKAREIILTSHERMQAPLSAERLRKNNHAHLSAWGLLNFLMSIIIVYVFGYSDFFLKYYISTLMLSICILFNKNFLKIFFSTLLLTLFLNWNSMATIYVMTIATFIYFNLGNIIVNRYFWT